MAPPAPESPTSVAKLRVPAELSQLALIFEFCIKFADAHQIGEDKRFALEVCLEEIVTNVMKYAYPPGTIGPVEISLTLEADTLQIQVLDEGAPFDPTSAPEVDTTLPLEQRPIGGLGLHMVRKMMDAVHYRREGERNLLTMISKVA